MKEQHSATGEHDRPVRVPHRVFAERAALGMHFELAGIAHRLARCVSQPDEQGETVDEGGKVQVSAGVLIPAGKAFMQDFHHPGGANRFEVRAVVSLPYIERKDAEALVPTVQVIDDATGRTSLILGTLSAWNGPITLR